MKRNIVVGISGASGVAYAVRLIEVLIASGCDVELSISRTAAGILKKELDLDVNLDRFNPATLKLDRGVDLKDKKLKQIRAIAGISSEQSNVLSVASGESGEIRYCDSRNLAGHIASGSFQTRGMVICPCSCSTLAAVAGGCGTNLIHRAAEVHLKERRKLILLTRETPLSLVQIENMRRVTEAGGTVMPASPGFYSKATTLEDLIDGVVARICDQLGVQNSLSPRWGG